MALLLLPAGLRGLVLALLATAWLAGVLAEAQPAGQEEEAGRPDSGAEHAGRASAESSEGQLAQRSGSKAGHAALAEDALPPGAGAEEESREEDEERRTVEGHAEGQEPVHAEGLGESHSENHSEGHTEGHGEGHGEGHEERATPVDVAISSCLCGGISLVMMMFYLVNSRDRDIRFYAWSVISSTITIFVAVLTYQGISGFLRRYFLANAETSVWGIVAISYLLMTVWMLVLQVVVAFIRDALQLPSYLCGNRHQMMQCWGRLSAHIAGFASIGAGCALQHFHAMVASPALATAIVVAHCAALAGAFGLFGWARAWAARRSGQCGRHWEEDACEMENDVAALSLSFLMVQVLRFAVAGVLPNHEGIEEPQFKHPFSCFLILFAAAVGFAGLVVLLVAALSQGNFVERSTIKRVLTVLQATAAMAFAWCIFFASKWHLKRLFPEWDINDMTSRVVLALAVSVGSFALIFVLDKLEDMDFTSRDVDRAIVSIISAMGILVGFSWEQSFEGAVAVFAGLTNRPECVKLGLAALMTLVVVPAWRSYILTALVQSEAKYLRNEQRVRTRKLDPEALAMALKLAGEAGVAEAPAPEVPRGSSRQVMLVACDSQA